MSFLVYLYDLAMHRKPEVDIPAASETATSTQDQQFDVRR